MIEFTKSQIGSVEVGRAALRIATTASRAEENFVKEELAAKEIKATAVDFGGEFVNSIVKIVERAVVAAERQGIVSSTYTGAGAVAGAANEALAQAKIKAMGFNVGGKIGIARCGENLCVAIFIGIGVLNLNEMCVGLAHRSLASDE